MNNITLSPPALPKDENISAADAHETEITAVMHELKNQICTISLAIAALKYPDETEDERQRHLASLEGVIADMNRQFHRLDDWLIQVGYKRKPGEAASVAQTRRAAKRYGSPHQSPGVKVIERHGLPLPFEDNQEL
jgi:hypothetical protein